VAEPAEWRWSSARAHLSGCDDRLVKVAPLLAMVPEWRALLDSALPEEWEQLQEFRGHSRSAASPSWGDWRLWLVAS